MPEDSSERKCTRIDYEVSGPNTVKIIIREDGTRRSVSTSVFSQDQAEQLTRLNDAKTPEPA